MSCFDNVLRPIDVTVVSGTSVTFVVSAQSFIDGQVYAFCDCTCLTGTTGTEYVYIQPFGGDSINVYAKGGNWLRYGRLMNPAAPKRLRMVYGADPSDRVHFEVIHDLPCELIRTATTAETA